MVRIGLSVYDVRAPDLLDLAVAADSAGFDAIWLGEHLLLPQSYGSVHPTHGDTAHEHHAGPIVDPETELLDPLVALGAAAAVTTRLKLATGIYLLPLRHPLVTARAVCSLHEISRGRFMLGVGAGWLREEFDALDVPFAGRGARLEEALSIVRGALAGGPVAHTGEHFTFGKVQVTPRPAEVPLVLGGNTERALRRAARLGDAWFSSGTPSFEDALILRDRLAQLCAEYGRGPLPCYFRVQRWDGDLVRRYEAEGIENLVLWADQVWPRTGESSPGESSSAEKRQNLVAAARRLGI
ncbi:MAG: TIGR03619 family F420-dependent LLM class oxidoreductase [Frankia sp.]